MLKKQGRLYLPAIGCNLSSRHPFSWVHPNQGGAALWFGPSELMPRTTGLVWELTWALEEAPQPDSQRRVWICLQGLLQLCLGKGRMAFRSGGSPIFTIRCQRYHLHFWFLRHKALPWTSNREYKHTRLLSENTFSNCLLFNSHQKPSWEKQYLQKIIWRTSSSSILQNTLNSIRGSNLTTSRLHTRAVLP